MQEDAPQSAGGTEAGGVWFLKVDENQVRGPVSLATLREWAEAGSLSADEELSRDGHSWQPAANLIELEMEWIADIGGGRHYGPFNLLATRHLVSQGILKSDSVLRRKAVAPALQRQTGATATAPLPRTARAARAPAMPATPSDSTRISQLERELSVLHAELATLQQQRQKASTQAPGMRALTATRPDELTERIDQIYDKAHRTEELLQQLVQKEPASDELPPSPVGAPLQHAQLLQPVHTRMVTPPRRHRSVPILYVDEGDAHADYEMNRPERVRELARVRRFRVQTLRWNVINSSLVVGTGSTVGAIGVILEVHPVTWTGLILAAIGTVHFLFTMLIWMGSKLINWAHVSIVSDTEAMAQGRPVRGMLNVTFFWFKRRFGSHPPS